MAASKESARSAPAEIRRAYRRACKLYHELASGLESMVDALKGKPGGLTEQDEARIKAHQQAILMVLNFESQIFKRAGRRERVRSAALDLAAAREEIDRRLACLEAAGAA